MSESSKLSDREYTPRDADQSGVRSVLDQSFLPFHFLPSI